MMSLSTPEYAVRKMVRAISSAMENSVFLNSSKAMGSESRVVIASDLDHDVAVAVEARPGVRRHHAGRVVLLDDAGPVSRRREIAAAPGWASRASRARGRSRRAGSPSRRPAPLGLPGRRARGDRGCLEATRGTRGALGNALGRPRRQAHDLDRLVGACPVAVGALVLAAERLLEPAIDAGRASRRGHGQLEGLALVAAGRPSARCGRPRP